MHRFASQQLAADSNASLRFFQKHPDASKFIITFIHQLIAGFGLQFAERPRQIGLQA